jgi:molybdenum cofactor cytidylyltransferase
MIAAVILAAGKSSRMGRSKLLLSWKGEQTIVRHLIETFKSAGATHIILVTGADRDEIEKSVRGIDTHLCYNPDFDSGGMISSVKAGLKALETADAAAALLCPGDLPLLKPETVKEIIELWHAGDGPIVAPSYDNRRGHPLLVARQFWPEIVAMPAGQSLRDFLAEYADLIEYRVVDDPGVIQDLDTYDEYLQALES